MFKAHRIPMARTRPWTPAQRYVDDEGRHRTRIVIKRECNGCGAALGDATRAEIAAAIAGQPVPDVRGECPVCLREARRGNR